MSHRATLFLFFLLALPLAAQQRVTRIEVSGTVPAEIVISQSALAEGRSYSESDLDAAVARIRRLPFVYDARWTLDGDTLRIDVTGTSRVFTEVDVISTQSDFVDDTTTFLGGGARQFLGSGMLEGAVNTILDDFGDAARAELSYSHYGIGGTRLFATAGVNAPLRQSDAFDPDPTWQLTVGYPLNVRQTLTASALRSGFDANISGFDLPGPVTSEQEGLALELRWAYDTSDDPFFARRGSILTADHTWRSSDEAFASVIMVPPTSPEITRTRLERDGRSIGVDARQFWSVGSRSTIFGGVGVSRGEEKVRYFEVGGPVVRGESETTLSTVSLGFGHNFFDRSGAVADGRHRVELLASATRRHEDEVVFDLTDNEQVAELSYLYRRRFATVRMSVMYGWD